LPQLQPNNPINGLQAKHYKTNMPIDDYELSDDGSVNDDPEHKPMIGSEFRIAKKKNSKISTSKEHQLSYLATKEI
jgi:hypothetical protein